MVGFAVGVVLELLDVLWLAVGVALALVLADALVLAEALRDGVALAEDEALPEGRALTEADALLDADPLADTEELPEAEALAEVEALVDVVGDFDAAACRAVLLAGFFLADFDAVAECVAVGDFAGWTAESSRTAALGRVAQAPFTMGGAPSPRSKVTEPNTVELVAMISAPATPPSATDLSATALTT